MDILNTIIAIAISLMNIFGGPFENDTANEVLKVTLSHVENVNANSKVNEDTGLNNVQEKFLADQYRESQNVVGKPGYLDDSNDDLYNHYQNKAVESLNQFHESIENGGF